MSPNPWIPQPAGELAVRHKHHQPTQLPRSLERVVGEKLFFRKRCVFLSFFHTIWLLGLNRCFFSFLNLLARGIKTTVVWSCIICLRWPTVIILTHFPLAHAQIVLSQRRGGHAQSHLQRDAFRNATEFPSLTTLNLLNARDLSK